MLNLHCKRCNGLIREVSIEEAKKLKGDEICKGCQQFADSVLREVNEEQKRVIREIGGAYNKAVVRLEELMRKVFND